MAEKVLDILRWLVPNAQIIVTTHSPHIVQSAERGEVISIKMLVEIVRQLYIKAILIMVIKDGQ